MRAKTLRPARAWTERTAGLATRPVPTRALDMVRAIFERACVGRVCGSMRRRRMDVSQENVPKEKRNRASCVSRFREFLFISVRAIRLTACFVKGAHWRFFPGSFCQTQMPQCHQRPMKTRELILTSRLRFFDLRTPEQLFAHSNRRLESWLATALLASGAECLLASVRARPPFERHTHPPTSSRVHAHQRCPPSFTPRTRPPSRRRRPRGSFPLARRSRDPAVSRVRASCPLPATPATLASPT